MARAAVVLFALLSSWAPLEAAETSVSTEFVCAEQVEMGTPFKICVYTSSETKMNTQFDFQKAFRKLRELNNWMSEWQSGTQLSKVNEAAGARAVTVGKDLFDLLQYTMKVSELTEGAFDPTFNAFWGLYNFKPGQQREPSDEQVRERLPLINWKNVELNAGPNAKDSSVRLKLPGMKLGLGGLGQGYGVDAIVKDLKAHYSAGFVDGSGDTYFWGQKPDGSLWTTAVRDPRDKNKTVLKIYGTDFAVTTSGDDEKYFMVGARRVHHIIDPKTGRPATASRQVTVISQRALDADAYDTGCFILGPVQGKSLLEKLGYRGVFVTDDGVTLTQGLIKKKTQWGEVYTVDGNLN